MSLVEYSLGEGLNLICLEASAKIFKRNLTIYVIDVTTLSVIWFVYLVVEDVLFEKVLNG